MSDKPFFIGYFPIPKGLQVFLAVVSGVFVGAMLVAAFVFGAGQDDPGPAAQRGDYGRQNLTGVIELVPYPLLHVTDGTSAVPAGRTLLMSGGGKSGVDTRAAPLVGGSAMASGVILERGSLQMLQTRGGRRGLGASDAPTTEIPAPQDLGRWRLAGEICDGKCLAGAMRPGRGLAHKACANLCLIGDVPPVFVSTQAVEGEEFLLITGPDNTKLPAEAYDFVAQYVSVEGQIKRHGDLLVFSMDPATLQRLD